MFQFQDLPEILHFFWKHIHNVLRHSAEAAANAMLTTVQRSTADQGHSQRKETFHLELGLRPCLVIGRKQAQIKVHIIKTETHIYESNIRPMARA